MVTKAKFFFEALDVTYQNLSTHHNNLKTEHQSLKRNFDISQITNTRLSTGRHIEKITRFTQLSVCIMQSTA